MREKWLIWCGTNAEQEAIADALGDECVSIDGRTPIEDRIRMEEDWRLGPIRCLVTKPAVMGWGMNWQHCAKMAFVGLSDSYEQYYQAIRRCYRYGQKRPVTAHIILTDREEEIYANVLRKEREASDLAAELISNISEFEREELHAPSARHDYEPTRELVLPAWLTGAAR